VADELTQFSLAGNHKAFWIPGDYDTNEYPYTECKISEINSSSMSAPLGGGAAIGPGGIATIAQMGIGNMQLDSNTNHQSHRKKGGVQREMKVAFTEIHNSSVDTKSAFLGDEKSIAGGKVFALMSQENRLGKLFYL
jgi:hypothetical protein